MRERLLKFTCDQCGEIVITPETKDDFFPDGWALVRNDDSEWREFNFSSFECYTQYILEHPNDIDECKAEFYHDENWRKGN